MRDAEKINSIAVPGRFISKLWKQNDSRITADGRAKWRTFTRLGAGYIPLHDAGQMAGGQCAWDRSQRAGDGVPGRRNRSPWVQGAD